MAEQKSFAFPGAGDAKVEAAARRSAGPRKAAAGRRTKTSGSRRTQTSAGRRTKTSGSRRTKTSGSRQTQTTRKPGRKGAPRSKPPADRPRRTREPAAKPSAADLAKKQRDISVSEFFAKNRHLLGFDNPSKALLTTVKEAVDNALDACEEAGIVPDIRVEVIQVDETRFRVAVEDNGPGIVRAQVPKIFGRLLYGSKFHRLRQSRGQQGIGISAAGMYGLLTTGKPIVITSRTGPKKQAHHLEVVIDTRSNEPKVKRDDVVEWDKPHGTRVEIELEGNYRGGQHSIDAYIRQISLANPHAEIVYVPPKAEEHGAQHTFARVTDELPPETEEIKPHPYGVELGVLMQMFRDTRSRNLRGCLSSDFSRVSSRLAGEICERAKVAASRRPAEIGRDEAERVHRAIQATKIMAPPTDCIAPIGEELIERALRAEVEADFFAAVTRRPTVYRGNPFLVEVGLAYGGNLPAEEPINVFRYANRVPLQYQQGACAITRAVTSTDWKKYGLQQPKGGVPQAPMLLMVHLASVWVPFTSESKEAIAHYPEIIKELRLALQECGRKMGTFLRRRRREQDEAKKRSYIEKYIPHVAIALQEILGFDDREKDRIVTTLSETLERTRKL